MQQIADWLQKLSLSQYAERFSEHGIDGSVLRYLTDQDLEKIGVLLGHRRKMLAAIAELGSAAALIEPKPQDTAVTCGRASPSFTGGWPKPILLSVTGLWLLIADHISGGCSDHSAQHPSKGDRCRNSC
jgi:hypothetical protein